MKKYKTINDSLGWCVFIVAAITYCSTVEPSASFWDCPEFISSAYLLEIGHPPGAPFFMLVGNLFSQFAADSSQVAKMINIMNALLSAGCILFLFWSITHLAKALLTDKDEVPTMKQTFAIMCSGVAGALIYTWSDTFWFSAVEGEVYAFSSFFTALVFWLILKWESNADAPRSDRWIILIAYLMGLSIGVHLLNLLCIPSIVLVVYYRKSRKASLKGAIMALAFSFLLIAVVLYGIVPGVAKVGGWFELLFVNVLGMPFNTGLIVYIVLIAITLTIALMRTKRRWLNTSLLCLTVMLIGYASYGVIMIRSCANPMMDENSPDNVFSLGSYLGREQYGDKPLLWGQTYCSMPEIIVGKDGKLTYATTGGTAIYQPKVKQSAEEKDEYVKVGERIDVKYPSSQCMWFPRIHSERHAEMYEDWLGETDKYPVEYSVPGQYSPETVMIPSMGDNLRFFFSYQLDFMYWRYFMWNFAGRQNDIQGNGSDEYGNWLIGFSVFDDIRLGDQQLLPSDLRDNKGHNVFYCLPLLLGITGMLWQFLMGRKGKQQFGVVAFLFFMTGIAIVLYVNQTPCEPRERDYSYAGSFYAFSIWCGLGIAALYDFLKKRAAWFIAVPALAIPLQMVSQTWDDHDRSNRFMCRDFGQNYLESVADDAILFTNGDNETFPLWYNQDVEGKRTDVRVCNMSYLQTDWYIDQMKRQAWKSDALPISWPHDKYMEGVNEMIDVNPMVADGMRVSDAIAEIQKSDPELAKRLWGDDPFELKTAIKRFILQDYDGLSADEIAMARQLPVCLPSDSLHITVDNDAVRKSGMKLMGDIPDKMVIDLKNRRRISKALALVLDMLANTNFSRPMYFSITSGADTYGELYHHFVQEGLTYRLTPYYIKENRIEHGLMNVACDTQKMYENLMNRFHYGNASMRDIYIDETIGRMCSTHRRLFARLALQLIREGRREDALRVLERCERELPSYNLPHSYISGSLDMAEAYQLCGQKAKAEEIYKRLETTYNEYKKWQEVRK